MNWRQILLEAKAERNKLQKQANEIERKLSNLDLEIFRVEQGIKLDEKEKKIKEAEWKDPLEEEEVINKQGE